MVREDQPGDQRLIAYVVADSTQPGSEVLRRALTDKLPGYMIPQTFVFLESLPQTPNKKIDRRALPVPCGPELSGAVMTLPQDDTQRAVAGIWRDALSIDRIDIDSNFIDLGGHSLLSVKVQIELKRRLHKTISLVDVFRNPTIRGLAAFLDKAQAAQTLQTKPESAKQDRPDVALMSS
jgi:acyl carrier protein